MPVVPWTAHAFRPLLSSCKSGRDTPINGHLRPPAPASPLAPSRPSPFRPCFSLSPTPIQGTSRFYLSVTLTLCVIAMFADTVVLAFVYVAALSPTARLHSTVNIIYAVQCVIAAVLLCETVAQSYCAYRDAVDLLCDFELPFTQGRVRLDMPAAADLALLVFCPVLGVIVWNTGLAPRTDGALLSWTEGLSSIRNTGSLNVLIESLQIIWTVRMLSAYHRYRSWTLRQRMVGDGPDSSRRTSLLLSSAGYRAVHAVSFRLSTITVWGIWLYSFIVDGIIEIYLRGDFPVVAVPTTLGALVETTDPFARASIASAAVTEDSALAKGTSQCNYLYRFDSVDVPGDPFSTTTLIAARGQGGAPSGSLGERGFRNIVSLDGTTVAFYRAPSCINLFIWRNLLARVITLSWIGMVVYAVFRFAAANAFQPLFAVLRAIFVASAALDIDGNVTRKSTLPVTVEESVTRIVEGIRRYVNLHQVNVADTARLVEGSRFANDLKMRLEVNRSASVESNTAFLLFELQQLTGRAARVARDQMENKAPDLRRMSLDPDFSLTSLFGHQSLDSGSGINTPRGRLSASPPSETDVALLNQWSGGLGKCDPESDGSRSAGSDVPSIRARPHSIRRRVSGCIAAVTPDNVVVHSPDETGEGRGAAAKRDGSLGRLLGPFGGNDRRRPSGVPVVQRLSRSELSLIGSTKLQLLGVEPLHLSAYVDVMFSLMGLCASKPSPDAASRGILDRETLYCFLARLSTAYDEWAPYSMAVATAVGVSTEGYRNPDRYDSFTLGVVILHRLFAILKSSWSAVCVTLDRVDLICLFLAVLSSGVGRLGVTDEFLTLTYNPLATRYANVAPGTIQDCNSADIVLTLLTGEADVFGLLGEADARMARSLLARLIRKSGRSHAARATDQLEEIAIAADRAWIERVEQATSEGQSSSTDDGASAFERAAEPTTFSPLNRLALLESLAAYGPFASFCCTAETHIFFRAAASQDAAFEVAGRRRLGLPVEPGMAERIAIHPLQEMQAVDAIYSPYLLALCKTLPASSLRILPELQWNYVLWSDVHETLDAWYGNGDKMKRGVDFVKPGAPGTWTHLEALYGPLSSGFAKALAPLARAPFAAPAEGIQEARARFVQRLAAARTQIDSSVRGRALRRGRARTGLGERGRT